ncbi:MAG: DUF5798 family protein [Halobacteriota archaeon]
MGLGSTAKRIQTLTETAEELYGKLSEVLDRVRGIERSIEETNERVTAIEARLERQERLLTALAEANGVDVEGTSSTEAEAPGDANA